jgi:hypothetical protein
MRVENATREEIGAWPRPKLRKLLVDGIRGAVGRSTTAAPGIV